LIEAFVLLRIKPGMDRSVFKAVKKLKQINQTETVYGEYDMLTKVTVETMDDLDAFIFDKVRTIIGIERTTTLIVIEPPGQVKH
jgi:DNA-binding Lrp family transcriptional regulator